MHVVFSITIKNDIMPLMRLHLGPHLISLDNSLLSCSYSVRSVMNMCSLKISGNY
jgi:hypothetical protein